MNYIYDIMLNFNKEYFEFFQWRKGDRIINVKKIPVFRVNDVDLYNFKYNNIVVDSSFLEKIYNLTLFYNKTDNSKYVCLVSNGSETIGLLFNKDGKLIKRSSLIFDEEEEVNEEVVNSEILKINYIQNEKLLIEFITRGEKEKRNYLFKFINNLDCDKDFSVLQYIYYDYFEIEEFNVKKIKKEILNELNVSGNVNKLFKLVEVLRKIKN